jgi:hypothetical protein
MSMHIEIKINEKTIYTVKASNMRGDTNGECLYMIESKSTDGTIVTRVIHDRRDGALVLAMKALNEIDLEEKRDD